MLTAVGLIQGVAYGKPRITFKIQDRSPNINDSLVYPTQIVSVGIIDIPVADIENLTDGNYDDNIFDQTFEHVIAIDLPKERAMMHLDTIFTQTSYNEGILFNHPN